MQSDMKYIFLIYQSRQRFSGLSLKMSEAPCTNSNHILNKDGMARFGTKIVVAI